MQAMLTLPTDPMEAGLLLGFAIAMLCGAGGLYCIWRVRALDRRIAAARREQGVDVGAVSSEGSGDHFPSEPNRSSRPGDNRSA